MPFHLEHVDGGWKVQDDKGNYYSKKPLSRKRAIAQLRALYASYSRGHSHRGAGYATYSDDEGRHHIVLQGNGFFSDVFAKAKRVAKVVASKLTMRNLQAVSDVLATGIRETYPPDVRNILGRFGSGQVYHITLCREPVKSYINTVLNIISLGSWNAAKNKMNYDKMFHLSMIVDLAMPEGSKVSLKIEKNEVINMTTKVAVQGDAERMDVPVPCCITLIEMLQKAEQTVGTPFFTYDAFTNNCQAFILSILKANGLASPDITAFVSQDAEALLKELPEHVPAFASAITNLAGFWNRLYKGQGGQMTARGYLRGGKLYCGNRVPPPAGYSKRGTSYECFRKGVGVGLALAPKAAAAPAPAQARPPPLKDLERMTIRELGQEASQQGVRGYSRMKRAQLIEALRPLRALRGGGAEEDAFMAQLNQAPSGMTCPPGQVQNARGFCSSPQSAQDILDERAKFKDVAGVGTRYDQTDPFLDIAIANRKHDTEASRSLVKTSDVPDVPSWDKIPTFPNDQPPPNYTGFVRMGTYDPSMSADEQWGKYNIVYYKDGTVVRTQLQPGAQLKYDLSGLRKQIESTWGNQFGGLHYINSRNYTDVNDQCRKDGTCQAYDENGNEKFNTNKHLSLDFLNGVEGRHARELNPALEEWFQRAKEQEVGAKGLNADKLDEELESKYQREVQERYDPTSDWITDMRGSDITDQYNNTKKLHQARLRKDGGFDIQFTDGTWDYMPGEEKWDCNAFSTETQYGNMNSTCGVKGREQTANATEKMIRDSREKQWNNLSDGEKFVNGLSVAGAFTSDYVLPVVSQVASFIPGAGFIGDIADLTGDITGAIQQGQCRHFNECTEQQVKDARDQITYHDTIGDRVASRYFNDPTMMALAEHNDKVLPLLGDTYKYGSRAGKFDATGQGAPHSHSVPIHPTFRKQLKQIGFTPEAYLKVAREIADEEGYDGRALEFSDDDEHKLMIYDDEGSPRRFGRVGYDDYILWSKKEALGLVPGGYAEMKRRVFNRSHSKIKGDWKSDKFSPNNLALRLLWSMNG